MKKVVLIIRDGWGNAKAGPYNAVSNANIPNITRYLAQYPHTEIEASGEQVGLPAGYMGSSEVGHLNMGAGRIDGAGAGRRRPRTPGPFARHYQICRSERN